LSVQNAHWAWYRRALICAVALVLLGGLLVDSICRNAQAQPQTEDSESREQQTIRTLVKGIKHNYDGIESARGVFFIRYEKAAAPLFADAEGPQPEGTQKYWWAFSDRAFREEMAWLRDDADKRLYPTVIAFDGEQGYYWSAREERGMTYSDLDGSLAVSNVGRWLGLAYRYDSASPCPAEVIERSKPVLGGREDVDGAIAWRAAVRVSGEKYGG